MERIICVFVVLIVVAYTIGHQFLSAWQEDEGALEKRRVRKWRHASIFLWPFYLFLLFAHAYKHLGKFLVGFIVWACGITIIACVWAFTGDDPQLFWSALEGSFFTTAIWFVLAYFALGVYEGVRTGTLFEP
jgi:hypothetical protein